VSANTVDVRRSEATMQQRTVSMALRKMWWRERNMERKALRDSEELTGQKGPLYIS
jgi:hypothetical protein